MNHDSSRQVLNKLELAKCSFGNRDCNKCCRRKFAKAIGLLKLVVVAISFT
jgi:hypothetical protein